MFTRKTVSKFTAIGLIFAAQMMLHSASFPTDIRWCRMKMLSVNEEGTFLDGLYLGSTTIDDLQLKNHENISFSVDCRNPDSSLNGGVTLFGIGFGDYNQGIRCRLFYTEEKN